MSRQQFLVAVSVITDRIRDRKVDESLAALLNSEFPGGGDLFGRLKTSCAAGEAEGWLMAREAAGIKFGRAVKPNAEVGRFSVDVVRMKDIKGPHHIHPTGEIGVIMTISGTPRFDGLPEGWYVYPPGSDHYPTMEGGDAYVLYLLPNGEINFTGC